MPLSMPALSVVSRGGGTMRCSGPRMFAVLATLVWVAAGQLWAADPVQVCTQHLKTIGRALAQYQRDHGAYPPRLSALYPKYVKQKAIFFCPADKSLGRTRGYAPDPRMHVSYSYEMGSGKWQLLRLQLGYLTGKPISTWRDLRTVMRANFGDMVPIVQCWHHNAAPSGGRASPQPFVLNLTASGHVYRSIATWEADPQVLASVLECLERDLKAGPTQFAARWNPVALHGYLQTVADRWQGTRVGAPQNLRLQLLRAAGRLESTAAAVRRDSPRVYMAAAGAYRLAGLVQSAAGCYEKAMASPEVRQEAGLALARMYESVGRMGDAEKACARIDPGSKLVGTEAPDFSLKDTAGNSVRLSEFRGKVVLLEFLTFG